MTASEATLAEQGLLYTEHVPPSDGVEAALVFLLHELAYKEYCRCDRGANAKCRCFSSAVTEIQSKAAAGKLVVKGRSRRGDLKLVPSDHWLDAKVYEIRGEWCLAPARPFAVDDRNRTQWQDLSFDPEQIRTLWPALQRPAATWARKRGGWKKKPPPWEERLFTVFGINHDKLSDCASAEERKRETLKFFGCGEPAPRDTRSVEARWNKHVEQRAKQHR
jgi:hypothetical protein